MALALPMAKIVVEPLLVQLIVLLLPFSALPVFFDACCPWLRLAFLVFAAVLPSHCFRCLSPPFHPWALGQPLRNAKEPHQSLSPFLLPDFSSVACFLTNSSSEDELLSSAWKAQPLHSRSTCACFLEAKRAKIAPMACFLDPNVLSKLRSLGEGFKNFHRQWKAERRALRRGSCRRNSPWNPGAGNPTGGR